MVCGPIGWGFESLHLPIFYLISFKNFKIDSFYLKSFFFIKPFNYNTFLWQEGLFVDFLQKLSVNRVLLKIVNQAFTITSEKLVFEALTRISSIFIITPTAMFASITNESVKLLFLTFLAASIVALTLFLLISIYLPLFS